MSFARNIIRDLVEKRLWPVALLMVIAAVAIPVLGGGLASSKSTSDEALPAAPDATSASTAVELLGPPSVHKRPGKLVDPFRRAHKKQVETTTTTPAAATSAPTGGTTAPGTTTTKPAAPKPSLAAYRTTVRWTSSGESTSEARTIKRLTPFGDDVLDPAVMYLGVSQDGKRAIFLLGPNAKSQGDAGCREASCRVISLYPGDTQIVDLSPDDATPSQFELELVSVKRHTYSTAAKAAAARAVVHPDGRDVLALMLQDGPTKAAVAGFGYDRPHGVIVKTNAIRIPSGG